MTDASAKNVADRYLNARLQATTSSASDATCQIVLRREIAGARDLRVALLDLAAQAAGDSQIRWVLATRVPRVSAERVATEWRMIARLLRPELTARMGVVAFGSDGLVVQPADLNVRDKLTVLELELPPRDARGTGPSPAFGWTPKTFAVWRALLDAWLNAEDTLPVETLQRRSGCSYPTARAVIDHLSAKRELTIRKDRSLAFGQLPRRSLEEVLVGSDRLRGTCRFIDATGAPPDAGRLLRRVLARRPEAVQVGGVAAARHYVPEFDLNGLPRLDLSVGRSARDAMNELDLGLEVWVDAGAPPLVVVHEKVGGGAVPEPYAPAADTFLDLLELGLTEQAEMFANRYRQLQEARDG